MRLPSPDAALISAFDAMLAIPQRRGVPLPAVLVPFAWLPVLACPLVIASLPLLGATLVVFVPAWLLFGGWGVMLALRHTRTLRSDAANWTPERIAFRHAEAMRHRERMASVRGMLLAFALMLTFLALAGIATGEPRLWPLTLTVLAYDSLAIGTGMMLYAWCTLPASTARVVASNLSTA